MKLVDMDKDQILLYFAQGYIEQEEVLELFEEAKRLKFFPINDEAMKIEIIGDLVTHRGYPEEEAKLWTEEHGSKIISAMWDAESAYIEENAQYLLIDEDEDDEEES